MIHNMIRRSDSTFVAVSGMFLGLLTNGLLGIWGVFAVAFVLIGFGIWIESRLPESLLDKKDKLEEMEENEKWRL